MKVCSKCSTEKSLELFYNDKRHSDGKMSRCKACHHLAINDWRNRNRDICRAYDKEHRVRNPGKVRHDRAIRHAAQMNARPKWLTKDHLNEIKQFYVNCPAGYEVDHIVPLRGKEVKGLHVIWNLRYLNKSDNRKKSNKLI